MKPWLLFFFLLPLVTYGAEYVLLEPSALPGSPSGGITFEDYLNGAFSTLLVITTLGAIAMVFWGGFDYLTAQSFTRKSGGRERIQKGLVSLGLALSIWFFLYQLNPKFLDFNLVLESVGSIGKGGEENGGGGGLTPPDLPPEPDHYFNSESETDIRNRLAEMNIGVNNPDPCVMVTNGKQVNITYQEYREANGHGCTSLAGLHENAISGLSNLRQNCPNCSITVSGGTEYGHRSHGVGKPIVDLRPSPDLDKYITNNAVSSSRGGIGTTYIMANGDKFLYETAGDTHWHVVFH